MTNNMIETFHISYKNKKIKKKFIDLDKIEKIGTTGPGYALKYKKGKTIFLDFYDDWVIDTINNILEDKDNDSSFPKIKFVDCKDNIIEDYLKENPEKNFGFYEDF